MNSFSTEELEWFYAGLDFLQREDAVTEEEGYFIQDLKKKLEPVISNKLRGDMKSSTRDTIRKAYGDTDGAPKTNDDKEWEQWMAGQKRNPTDPQGRRKFTDNEGQQ